jgi:cytochrome b561
MAPVRLKYFGVALTRKGYLAMQLGLLVLLAVLILVLARLAAQVSAEPAERWGQLLTLLVHNLYWIVPLALVLDGLEVLLVLRRFAQKEAQERQQAPGPTT